MARILIFSIVCLAFFNTNGQTLIPPFVSAEAENRMNFIDHFSQPLQLRGWEIHEDTLDAWRNWDLVENFSFGKDRGSIPMIADLQSLHPYFRDKVLQLIHACKAKGIELAVVETYRTRAKQNEYRAMGRRYTRSKAGHSKHQYGLAVDVVPVIDSVVQWHNIALWRKVGAQGERLGLRWGGRWRHLFDPGHFEWTGGLGSYQLAQGVLPPVPKSAHYPCIEDDLQTLKRHWSAWETEQSAVAKKESEFQDALFSPVKVSNGGGNE
jgi:hypothetical protein